MWPLSCNWVHLSFIPQQHCFSQCCVRAQKEVILQQLNSLWHFTGYFASVSMKSFFFFFFSLTASISLCYCLHISHHWQVKSITLIVLLGQCSVEKTRVLKFMCKPVIEKYSGLKSVSWMLNKLSVNIMHFIIYSNVWLIKWNYSENKIRILILLSEFWLSSQNSKKKFTWP